MRMGEFDIDISTSSQSLYSFSINHRIFGLIDSSSLILFTLYVGLIQVLLMIITTLMLTKFAVYTKNSPLAKHRIFTKIHTVS